MASAEEEVREIVTAESGTVAILNKSEIDQQIEVAGLGIGAMQHRAEHPHIRHAVAQGNGADRVAVLVQGVERGRDEDSGACGLVDK